MYKIEIINKCVHSGTGWWNRNFLSTLGINVKIVLMCDNTGALQWIEKEGRKEGRTKHIDLRHHHLTDMKKNNELEAKYLKTSEQLADIFTKPLGKILFQKFRKDIGVIDLGDNSLFR